MKFKIRLSAHGALGKMAIAVAMLSCVFTANGTGIDFTGKDGRGIAQAIAETAGPRDYVASESEIWDVIAEYARVDGGLWRDYFSSRAAGSKEKLSLQYIVPLSWWRDTAHPVDMDLHNIVPGNRESELARGDNPPGIVTEADFDNGYWRSGTGWLMGMEAGFFEPADELKGDFARVFMYMSIVYGVELWHGRGVMVFVDGGYPYLNGYGREILMKWHRGDPVDDDERHRDEAIAACQGLGNPFVAEPDLAEYIWGTHSGETVPEAGAGDDDGDGDNDSDDPGGETPDDGEKPLTELKGVYSLSSDRWISLRTPYVGSGARWTFDGKAVDGLELSLEGVAEGRHELRYSCDDSAGMIIITVTK